MRLKQQGEEQVKTIKLKILLLIVAGGAIVTLLTGLIPNTPPFLVGAVHYGYPLAWLFRLVVAPQYYPWRVDAQDLILDFIAWSAITGMLVFIFRRFLGAKS